MSQLSVLIVTIFASLLTFSWGAAAAENDLRLWYTKPALKWDEALPVGGSELALRLEFRRALILIPFAHGWSFLADSSILQTQCDCVSPRANRRGGYAELLPELVSTARARGKGY